VKFIATYALTFFGYIISVLGSVWSLGKTLSKRIRKEARLGIRELKVGQSAHFLLASSPSNQILLHFALDGPVCDFLFAKQ
jgi:hypothetical protein